MNGHRREVPICGPDATVLVSLGLAVFGMTVGGIAYLSYKMALLAEVVAGPLAVFALMVLTMASLGMAVGMAWKLIDTHTGNSR